MLVSSQNLNQTSRLSINQKSPNSTPSFKGKVVISEVLKCLPSGDSYSFAWYNWLHEVTWKDYYLKIKSPIKMIIETLKNQDLLVFDMEKTVYSSLERKTVPAYNYKHTTQAFNAEMDKDTKAELNDPYSVITRVVDAIKNYKHDIIITAKYPVNLSPDEREAPLLFYKRNSDYSLSPIGKEINGYYEEGLEQLITALKNDNNTALGSGSNNKQISGIVEKDTKPLESVVEVDNDKKSSLKRMFLNIRKLTGI